MKQLINIHILTIVVILCSINEVVAQSFSNAFTGENSGVMGVHWFPTNSVGNSSSNYKNTMIDISVGNHFLTNNWSGVRSEGFNYIGQKIGGLMVGDWNDIIFSREAVNAITNIDTSNNLSSVSGITSQKNNILSILVGKKLGYVGDDDYNYSNLGVGLFINRCQSLNVFNVERGWYGLLSEGFKYPDVYGQRRTASNQSIKYSSWSEIGISLGYSYIFGDHTMISAALQPKFSLQQGIGGITSDNFEYETNANNTLDWISGDAMIIRTQNIATNTYLPLNGQLNFSMDLGFAFKHEKISAKVSFLDIGGSNIVVNTQAYQLGSTNAPMNTRLTGLDDLSARLASLNNGNLADSENQSIRVGVMPSMAFQIRLQTSDFENHWSRTYISFFTMFSLKKYDPSNFILLNRPSFVMGISPGFELGWGNFYFPLSIEKGIQTKAQLKLGFGMSIGTFLFAEYNGMFSDLINVLAYKGVNSPQIAVGLRFKTFRSY